MHYTYSGAATMTPEQDVCGEMRKALEDISPDLVKYQNVCIAEDVQIEDLKLLRLEQLRALGVRRMHPSSQLPGRSCALDPRH